MDFYEADTAVGFWIRRRLDGSANEINGGLIQIMQAYDKAFVSEHSLVH